MADVMKRDAELFHQMLELFMIADHRANLRGQLAGVMPDQQITQTMSLRRRHDHNRLLFHRHEFDDGGFRQNLFEIGNHPVRGSRPFEGRPHKEVLGLQVHKLLIAQDIVSGVVEDTVCTKPGSSGQSMQRIWGGKIRSPFNLKNCRSMACSTVEINRHELAGFVEL
jgi:hypothetical protein